MLNEVESYWSRPAESYSEVVCGELNHINEINWMNVILSQIPEEKNIKIADMGTGPGLFCNRTCEKRLCGDSSGLHAGNVEPCHAKCRRACF